MTDDRKVPQHDVLFRDVRGRRLQPRSQAVAERRAAARAAFLALREEEKDAIYARIDRLLFGPATVWKVARSMMENPHSYAHRRGFQRNGLTDADFCFLIEMIRAGGVIGCERQRYHGRWYDTFVRRHPASGIECRFWPMNWPLNDSRGGWLTVILNRKPVLETDV